jgi:quercetin dioxygenase-like cupin family protein
MPNHARNPSFLLAMDHDSRIRWCLRLCGEVSDNGRHIIMSPVIASDKLERTKVWGEDDASVRWAGAFVTCGGRGATQSSTIVYEIEPGGQLGWHTDATEETQYIIAGKGELQTEDGSYPVGPGSVFVLPTNVRHNLVNVGSDRLRAVAFFAAAMFTQRFDNVMLPPMSHVLGTPNREG